MRFFKGLTKIFPLILFLSLLPFLGFWGTKGLLKLENSFLRQRLWYSNHKRVKEDEAQSPITLIWKDFPRTLERKEWVTVIKNLRSLKARVIGLDILLEGARDPDGDRLLWETLAEKSDIVVAVRSYREFDEKGKWSEHSSRLFGKETFPFPVGSVHVHEDIDSSVTQLPLFLKFQKRTVPTLSLALFCLEGGFMPQLEDVLSKVNEEPLEKKTQSWWDYLMGRGEVTRIHSFDIPTQKGLFWFHYFGMPYFPGQKNEPHLFHISLKKLLDPIEFEKLKKDENNVIEGATVIIGTSDYTDHDYFKSPLSTLTFGPEIHANALLTLHSKKFPSSVPLIDLLYFLISGCFLWLVFKRFNPLNSFVLFSLFSVFHIIFIFELGAHFRLYLLFLPPMLVGLLLYVTSAVLNYFKEFQRRQHMQFAFGLFLSPKIVEKVEEEPALLALGGKVREISAFFSDIQSFSSFSEAMTPTDLVEVLNEYLSEMTEILLKEEGTLDKYIGDAIVAFFGAPVEDPNHSLIAITVAIKMQKRLGELRKRWSDQGDKYPELVRDMRMRIGINTGEAVVGNMGSKNRMNYTMMGDMVNLAARLEAAAKQYGVYTLVSESALKGCRDHFVFREIDFVKVVGKTEPARIFEILDFAREKGAHENLVQSYNKGLTFFRKGEFELAVGSFETALNLEINTKKSPSKIWLERSKKALEKPESVPVGQIFSLTEK